MKATNLLFAAAIGLSLVSCKKDDKCEVSDWAGTYEVTGTCGKATFTLSVEGDNLILSSKGIKTTMTNGSDDCTKTIKYDDSTHSYSLSGDEITLKDTEGSGITCTYTGKKK